MVPVHRPLRQAIVWTCVTGFCFALAWAAGAQDEASTTSVFELRTYTAAPGKSAEMLDQFEKGKSAILGKNGLRPLGFWTPVESPLAATTLVYLLEFETVHTAKTLWERFAGDPLWRSLRARTEKEGSPVAATANGT